ncbi:MAG: LamG-like jellyroll fold domain-containing protein, partial [Limisphaerales bacterium]
LDTSTGTFNYLVLTNSPDLAFGANDSFSLSFWVNYTSWPNDDPFICNAINATYQQGWVLCDYAGKIECSLASVGNSGTYIQAPLPNSPTTSDGAWHNVVMILDRGVEQASVYVDGLVAGNWSISGLGSMYYNNPIAIGNDPTGAYGASGGGSIDDVGIWRRALTPLEAAGIYVAGISNNVTFAASAVTLALERSGAQLQLSWPSGALQSADQAAGPYTDITPAPTSPYLVTPSLAQKFYRVRVSN